jgi:hypothetical protein
MPDRGVEDQGVVVICDCLFDCFIYRLSHRLVIFAVAKLTYNQTTQMSQYTTHTQVTHHAVDMIMPLGNVFDE